MPTSGDDMFLWRLNNMPRKLIDYMAQLDYSDPIPDSTEMKDHPDSNFFSRGPLVTVLTTILLLVIDNLPQEQRWMYYWLMLLSHQNLVRQVYLAVYAEALLLWYWPTASTIWMYFLTIIGDSFARSQTVKYGVFQQELLDTFYKQGYWLGQVTYILGPFISQLGLIAILEPMLGPANFWPRALLPVMICLLAEDERTSINAFSPEGGQGISLAATLWALSKTPTWIQWALWPLYSCPKSKGMASKWAICTLLWMWYDTPPQVAYGLYLFMNQFPQSEFGLRRGGGSPSTILTRERYGCICYITTSVLFKLVEISQLSWTWESLVWLYLLRGRRTKWFRYRPIQDRWIRLLRLRARSINSDIQCDLIHVAIDSPPRYTAVSYRWSSESKTRTITVDGAPFQVPESIHTLLVAKRELRHHVLLWVDSICIDQSNTEEKNQQVSFMRSIYEEAHSTIAWLGDSPEASKAIDLIRRLDKGHELSKGDSGLNELTGLISNPWFKRSWIIQEIAASTNPLIRYGKQEVEWKAFVNAISQVITYSLASDIPHEILENSHLVNALAIENARLSVENIDHLRLQDVLRLGTIFQATLPVDKVFALLGITEERKHLDFSAGRPNHEYWHSKNLFQELFSTVESILSLQATARGYRNSRRCRKIINHVNGLRYLKSLRNYQIQVTKELLWLAEKNKNSAKKKRNSTEKPKTNYDVLRPEYSLQTTPERVFSLVAKTMLGKGEHSILRHAGIGLKENAKLKDLPSWAPDWSSGLHTYMLPSSTILRHSEAIGAVSADASRKDLQVDTPKADVKSFFDGTYKSKYESLKKANFYFHTISGIQCGRVRYLAYLNEDPVVGGNTFEAAQRDLCHRISNYRKALKLALTHCNHLYNTQEAIESAFVRTVLVLEGNGESPTPDSDHHDYLRRVFGDHGDCNISAALWPEKYAEYWKDTAPDTESLQKARDKICWKYMSFRRIQSSSHAKFAHMIQTVVLPSYNSYRWPVDKKQSSTSSDNGDNGEGVSGRGLSFFGDKERSPLSAYDGYVDFALGRKFAITDSGHMALVPWGAREGDNFVYAKNVGLCFLLREALPPEGSQIWKMSLESDLKEATDSQRSYRTTERLYRLVGESYVHDLHRADDGLKVVDEADFKLW